MLHTPVCFCRFSTLGETASVVVKKYRWYFGQKYKCPVVCAVIQGRGARRVSLVSASNDHMEGPRRVTSPPSFEIKDPRWVKVQLPLLKNLHPYKTLSFCHEFKSSYWSKTEKNYVSCYGPAVSGCDCKLIHHSLKFKLN